MGKFITKEEVAGLKRMIEQQQITEELAADIIVEGTPSLWIEANLADPNDANRPIKLRPYQHEVLSDCKTIGIRWGRQIGKEQPYSSKVLTPNGFVTMGEIQPGMEVIAMDGTATKVIDTFEQGIKDVYRLEFTDGSTVECGLDHLWLCRTKKRYRDNTHRWRTLSLKKIIELGGMEPTSDKAIRIPLPKAVVFEERKHVLSPYVLGVLLGDGCISTKGSNTFTSADIEIVEKVKRELPDNVILKEKLAPNSGKAFSYSICYDKEWHKNRPYQGIGVIESELLRLKLKGTKSGDKFIPWEYLHDSVENRIEILRGLMDTDGYASKHGTYEYCTKSKRLSDDFVWLVESLGGKVKTKEKIVNGKVFYYSYVRQLEMNPFYLPRKAEKFYKIKYFPTRTLKKIELVRKELSKCITVDHPSHTYLTDHFIVTHNTLVLSARILWEIFTEENLTVILFAPTKKHLNDIFDYVEKMLKTNKELIAMIKKEDRSGPKSLFSGMKGSDAIPKIELINGSSVKFFHTQTKRAWEQIRGTRGSKLFFDETAFIAPEAFTALSGLLTSADDLFIWAQSTPLGTEGWFYDFCQSAQIHSHHTSMESPQWGPEKERLARLLAPDEGSFAREYLAHFVSGGSSAFTDQVVDAARDAGAFEKGEILFQQKNYLSSKQIEQMPGNTYIGVDWNIAANGTKITVWKQPAGMDSRIIYQDVISVETPTYTQMTAVERLFELCEKYQPLGIGLDKGYGALSLEIISEKLEEERYKWLSGRFEVVNFGEILYIPVAEFFGESTFYEIETIKGEDDSLEEMVKMPLKVFMVSVMTRLMLTENVVIPPLDIDKERKTLLSELRTVKIDKVSSNNYPVYSKINLHKFSSAMLAIYVFFLKSGNYHIVKEGTRKVIRKNLEPHKEESKFVVSLWNDVSSSTFFKPKVLTNRGITSNLASKTKGSISKEEMRQLGITTTSITLGQSKNQTKPPAGYGWANRRNNPSRRRI